jgi:peptidoglycan/LPS O-acetylase OafA/YrhL
MLAERGRPTPVRMVDVSTSGTAPSMDRRFGYVPALDGVRAVAIALVVSFHAVGLPRGGWLGVDLFFVLSGFLITTLLVEERARSGRISIGAFYCRRALRLLPALVVMLGTFLAVSAITSADGPRTLFGFVASIGYVSNLVLAGGMGERFPIELAHLWSLAAEEQFYLVWPLVLIVVGGRRRLLLALLVAGIAVTTARQFQLAMLGDDPRRILFAPDTRSVSILAGCMLALLMARRPLHVARLVPASLVFLAGGVVIFGVERVSLSGPPSALFALACVVVIAHALDGRSTFARVLSIAPMVFLGRISYGLYLWHQPIFVWLGTYGGWSALDLVAVPLAILVATASYYVVERPFLRLKHRPWAVPRGALDRTEVTARDLRESRSQIKLPLSFEPSRALATGSAMRGPDETSLA